MILQDQAWKNVFAVLMNSMTGCSETDPHKQTWCRFYLEPSKSSCLKGCSHRRDNPFKGCCDSHKASYWLNGGGKC